MTIYKVTLNKYNPPQTVTGASNYTIYNNFTINPSKIWIKHFVSETKAKECKYNTEHAVTVLYEDPNITTKQYEVLFEEIEVIE